jgi:transcriptional regulator with XRE-family HTH domain
MTETGDHADWVALGARLKEVREYLDLSQQVVAGRTGITRSAISDIERGQRKVDSLELRKLARLYGYPVSHFLGEEASTSETVTALTRAVDDLSAEDREEIIRFARYLRYNARAAKRQER